MKVNFVFVLFFSLFVTLVSAIPALKTAPEDTEWKSLFSEAEVNDLGDLRVKNNLQQKEEHGLRFRRVTCDLLSVSLPIGSLNHAGCAAHCLAKRKGYRGGRCKEGVCHCRK